MHYNKVANFIYTLITAFMLLTVAQNCQASNTTPDGPFVQVNSFHELKNLVSQSIGAKKPVLIYFFATWCHFCQAVNSNVFSDAAVQKSLGDITAIGVNSSDNTPSQLEMMDAYNVQAFPTIIVFNRDGDMIEPAQFQGGITKKNMLAVLKEIKG